MNGATVVWVESAEQELASIWLALPNRNKVTAATHEIDHALKRDALSEGVELCVTIVIKDGVRHRWPLRARAPSLRD